MHQHFRFASEEQSRSSPPLAERSPACKHELCRFASNAVVMRLAAGSDESQKDAAGLSALLLGHEKEPPAEACD